MKIQSHIHDRQGCPECAKLIANNKYTTGKLTVASKLTTELLCKAHPNIDFSNSNIRRRNDIITAQCPIHGEFKRQPYLMLLNGGYACEKCNRADIKEQELKLLIESLTDKFNSRFKYPDVDSFNSKKSIINILCNECNTYFLESLYNHAQKGKCPSCYSKLIMEQRIESASKLYDGLYSYNKVTSHVGLVTITCMAHGDFKTDLGRHSKGLAICPRCAFINKKIKMVETFKNNAHEKFNDQFSYDEDVFDNYINDSSLIRFDNIRLRIECKDHGFFYSKPSTHLKSDWGICRECLRIKRELEFIKESRSLHNNRYTYENYQWAFNDVPSYITCPKHGDFIMRPSGHIGRLSGCPECGFSSGELEVSKVLREFEIIYEYEKEFDDLVGTGGGRLRFDFFVESLNLCIEFDGRQHFEANEHFGGTKQLENQQRHDELKNTYCEDSGIHLIRIPYNVKSVRDTLLSQLLEILKK
ncbi:MAG: hypothetical protein KAH25_03030 [Bacteroidales bacterium]|nr:hypothetical protein [Bacteroidales bacterium]